jgi:hypothetical protein
VIVIGHENSLSYVSLMAGNHSKFKLKQWRPCA